MGAFLFRCPNTDQHVQGWSAEEVDPNDERYETITCTACLAVHLVNPGRGMVAGAHDGTLICVPSQERRPRKRIDLHVEGPSQEGRHHAAATVFQAA